MASLDSIHYDGPESIAACVNELVSIPGPVGRLEGITACPPMGRQRSVVAILCHPHPLYGGSMNNKVVYYLSRTCNDLGIPALRFNFRGVGASEGVYADGLGETEDLLAVIDWVRARRPQDRLWLAGFSFGAYVAYRAAAHCPSLDRLISVAPPVNLFPFASETRPHCPWTVLQGRQDDIVPCQDVEAFVRTLPDPPELICMEAADHYFHGKLNDLRNQLIRSLSLKPAPCQEQFIA